MIGHALKDEHDNKVVALRNITFQRDLPIAESNGEFIEDTE